MTRNLFNVLLILIILFIDIPVDSYELSNNDIEKYTLKISSKFAKTYCNTLNFGISRDGSLKFAISETNKEFLNNKLNIYLDHKSLNDEILLSLKKYCQIYDFPEKELDNLVFKE